MAGSQSRIGPKTCLSFEHLR